MIFCTKREDQKDMRSPKLFKRITDKVKHANQNELQITSLKFTNQDEIEEVIDTIVPELKWLGYDVNYRIHRKAYSKTKYLTLLVSWLERTPVIPPSKLQEIFYKDISKIIVEIEEANHAS